MGLGPPNPIPHPAPSLTLDLLRVHLMDTWWNYGHEFRTKD